MLRYFTLVDGDGDLLMPGSEPGPNRITFVKYAAFVDNSGYVLDSSGVPTATRVNKFKQAVLVDGDGDVQNIGVSPGITKVNAFSFVVQVDQNGNVVTPGGSPSTTKSGSFDYIMPVDSNGNYSPLVPSNPNIFPVSMNLNTGAYYQANRPFTNLALANVWATRNNSELLPPMPTNVNANGDLISIPAGGSWGRACRQPDTPGGVAMTMYWEGSPTGVDLVSGPDGTGFSGLSAISAYGSGYKRTFTQTWTTTAQYGGSTCTVRAQEASMSGDKQVRNLIVCESSIFDAAATVAGIPIWHDAYVANIIAMGYKTLRFGDMMKMNGQYDAPVTGPSSTIWHATIEGRGARQMFNPGTTNQSLGIQAQTYFKNTAYWIARTIAPSTPFAEDSNNIAVTILAPSATPGITIDDTVPGEVSIVITPDSAGTNPGSASRIHAQINAHALASNWIIGYSSGPSGFGSNTGTTPIGTFPKTFLQFGTKGLAQDGLPWSWAINLCQRTGCRPWFTAPMLGTQTYWEGLGSYLAANWSGLPAYIEMGNELWNYAFVVGGYITIAAGKAGITQAQQQGAWHNERMTWVRNTYPSAYRVLSSQAAGIGVYNNLRAVTGVLSNTDGVAIAPYFSHDAGCWTTPTVTTDIVVAADQMEMGIPTTTGWGVSYVNQAVNTDGKQLLWYEGQQHNISGQPDLATFQAMQRAPRMKRSIGIWLSEHKRLCPPTDGVLFIDVAPIGNINSPVGAFGFKESFLQDISAAPKMQAAVDAKNGIYPAYFLPGTVPSIPTNVYAAAPVSVTVPTIYNQSGPVVYLWKAAGGATAGTGGTTATYTPAAGDIGKVLTCEVTVSNGTDTFTYTSNASTAVQAVTKWKVIRQSDLVSGQFQVPSDWNSASNKVYALGPGGNGFSGTSSNFRGGGGSGGYSRTDNQTWTPSSMVSATIGLGGTGTATSIAAVITANAGGNATNVATTGGGAAAAAGTGTFTRAGTAGGGVTGTFRGCAGGAGAPGPDGPGGGVATLTGGSIGNGGGGANGGASVAQTGVSLSPGGNNRFGTGGGTAAAGQAGGPGSNGGGGGGGAASFATAHGGLGSNEIYFTDSVSGVQVGFGGGGGGAGDQANLNGGNGGYGAGGGGGRSTGLAGTGGDGWIVLEWNP